MVNNASTQRIRKYLRLNEDKNGIEACGVSLMQCLQTYRLTDLHVSAVNKV